jgi:hypothetical protein
MGGCALLAFFVAAVGCSDPSNGEVTGMVRIDGTPLEKGTITFTPADGKGQTAGGEIKAGKYSARVGVGKYKVSISMPIEDKRKKLYPTADSPEMWMYREGLPARYNEQTELELDVKSGTNQKDWDLQGK